MQQWRILQGMYFTINNNNHASIDSLEKAYNDKLTAEVGAAVVARSQAFGDSVASAIFNWAKSDLFDHVNDPYIIKVFLVHGFQRLPCFGTCRRLHGKLQTFPSNAFSWNNTTATLFLFNSKGVEDYFKIVNRVYNISQTLTDDQKI